TWTNGEILARVLRHRRTVGDLEHFYGQLGGIVAAMHGQSTRWALPAAFTRHALDADGLVGDAPFWGRFWEHPMLSSAERALFDTTRDVLYASLVRYGRDPATYGVIHADLHTGNVLLDGERLTAIDFDDAGFGWHAYDIAVALFNHRNAPEYWAVEAAFL